MLALDEQEVRWCWCMFEFECVITWYTIHDDTITITLSPNTFITMAMSHDYALILMLLEYMERCHVGFGRTVCTLVLVHV